MSYFAPGVETGEISPQDIDDRGIRSETQCIGQSIDGNPSSLASSAQSREADWSLKSPALVMSMANEIGQRPMYENEYRSHTVMRSSPSQNNDLAFILDAPNVHRE